jgi:hypothetical protein
MFSIEPMPSKVNFKLTLDQNKDQALLGDMYEIVVDIDPEDITLQDFQMIVENVDFELAQTKSEAAAQVEHSVNLNVS